LEIKIIVLAIAEQTKILAILCYALIKLKIELQMMI
jgi:hypothetical protein